MTLRLFCFADSVTMTMKLTDEHIKEFQNEYRNHFGVEIDAAKAREQYSRLIRLYEAGSRLIANIEARKKQEQSLTK